MNRTKLYYDGIAKGYKELYHNEQKRKINLILNELNNIPIKNLILDLGSGDGVLNEYLKDHMLSNNLISCDLSIKLLRLNNNHNKINKKSNRVNANIISLPFKENTFDNIISMTVIQDILDSRKAVSEIHRILKPNGELIISYLKNSLKREAIEYEIEQKFNTIKTIEEDKDIILILKRK